MANTKQHHLYEGLFLINQQTLGADLNGAIAHIQEILDRASAEVVTLQKWDDRRLAYPVRGQKRGLYIIALFRVDGELLVNIERDCNLSEHVLRMMVLRGDHIGEIEIDMVRNQKFKTATEAKLREDDEDDDTQPVGAAVQGDDADSDSDDDSDDEQSV